MGIFILVILCIFQLLLIWLDSKILGELYSDSFKDASDNAWGVFFILLTIANTIAIIFQSIIIIK